MSYFVKNGYFLYPARILFNFLNQTGTSTPITLNIDFLSFNVFKYVVTGNYSYYYGLNTKFLIGRMFEIIIRPMVLCEYLI